MQDKAEFRTTRQGSSFDANQVEGGCCSKHSKESVRTREHESHSCSNVSPVGVFPFGRTEMLAFIG